MSDEERSGKPKQWGTLSDGQQATVFWSGVKTPGKQVQCRGDGQKHQQERGSAQAAGFEGGAPQKQGISNGVTPKGKRADKRPNPKNKSENTTMSLVAGKRNGGPFVLKKRGAVG